MAGSWYPQRITPVPGTWATNQHQAIFHAVNHHKKPVCDPGKNFRWAETKQEGILRCKACQDAVDNGYFSVERNAESAASKVRIRDMQRRTS